MPSYANDFAAGIDLSANLVALPGRVLSLFPGQRLLVPTGVFLAIPVGYEGQVRPRSGLAAKHGITIVNAPGTVDCDYRGEIVVILLNTGQDTYRIAHGDRIAQMVVAPVSRAVLESVEHLSATERGEKGFGSTGQ